MAPRESAMIRPSRWAMDTLSDAAARRVFVQILQCNVRLAEAILDNAPETSLRAVLLRSQCAFVLAALSGDNAVAARAVTSLEACIAKSAAAQTPDTWGGWAASFVVSVEQTPAQQEAAAIQAFALLMQAMAHGMMQKFIVALLTMRRALAAFSALPEEPSTGTIAAVRSWGLGVFALLLALLPKPVASMLTLTGSWRSPFGAEGPSEALSVQLLEHAATCTGGAYDHGACWAALATLLLFKGSTLAKDGSAEQRSTQQGRANSSPTEQPLGTIDAVLRTEEFREPHPGRIRQDVRRTFPSSVHARPVRDESATHAA